MPGAKPYSLRHTLTHPLARMLPVLHPQLQVYRLGEKHPPSVGIPESGPVWESVNFVLAARDTLQARVNLQRMFTLMAITANASVVTNGGFRVQFYDTKKQRRFADRGVNRVNAAGQMGGVADGAANILRDPYTFDQPDSQILVIIQNLETSSNTVEIVFYGHVLRFNELGPDNFPGGPIPSALGGGRPCP